MPEKSVLLCCTASVGEYALAKIRLTTNQQFNGLAVKSEFCKKVIPEYLFWISSFFKEELVRLSGKTSFNFVSVGTLKKVQIPLPPLEIQEEIVAELDGYQKIINGAKQIIENYKPTIKIDPSWEMVELGEVVEIDPKKTEIKSLDPELEVSFLPMSDLQQKDMNFSFKQSKELKDVLKGYTYFQDNDVLLAKITPCFENGKSGIVRNSKNGIGFGSTEFIVLRSSEQILPEWIYLFISSDNFLKEGKNNMTGSAGQQRLTKDFVENYKIHLPPIETQKGIVNKIESEQKIINGNKKLIVIFEGKIKEKIKEIWGDSD